MSITQLSQLQILLDKVSVIDFQYQKTRKENKFNVFDLLSKRYDEVNLHSKFIHALLDPEGSHGYGYTFLEKFVSQLQLTDFKTEEAEVLKEYKNIDILIKNSDRQAIVIENKLWAVDQPAQLERYYNTLVKEGYNYVKVFYLSIDGKEAADHSVGELALLPDWKEIYTTISYNHEISLWLENCIKEAYNHPALRETLIQYKALINEITGKTMNKEEQDEIINLIAQGDNVLMAKKIAENWVHVKWNAERDFWVELEAKVKANYKVLDLQKYSSDKIDSVVHHTRNRIYWYGIMFQLCPYLYAEACIFVERGNDAVYYGLTMVKDNYTRIGSDPKFSSLATKVQEISEWGMQDQWIGGKYCSPEINFQMFSNETTLRLLNQDFREAYINKLWVSIHDFAEQCREIIKQLKAERV